MIKITERTEIIKEKKRYCDICESQAKAHCCKCGKDLCNKCVCHEDYSLGNYSGDCYCGKCWDIGKHYRNQISIYEDMIDKLNQEWIDKCNHERSSDNNNI